MTSEVVIEKNNRRDAEFSTTHFEKKYFVVNVENGTCYSSEV